MADRRHRKTGKLPFSGFLCLLLLLCFVSVSLLNQSSSSSSSPTPPPNITSPAPLTTATATANCSSLIDRAGVGAVNQSHPPLLCCDRAHRRTDVCYMTGDIRTSAASRRTIFLHAAGTSTPKPEKIRPYPRKWEKDLMATVDELTLRPSPPAAAARCAVRHGAPAVVFSTGGYTGNVYHEFNDGLIPLYITAEMFAGEVVLVVAEYHDWWFEKYRRVLEKMSRYEVVNLKKDKRVHCFPEMIVGLRFHGELAVDSNLMRSGKGIRDFQSLLNRAFDNHQESPPPRPPSPPLQPLSAATAVHRSSTLAILARSRSRRFLNLREILRLSRRAGFEPQLLSPKRSTPLAEIRRFLAAADVMVAVHGAAVTHFMFMRPGTALIQVVPLGLDWPAETYYGEPARRMGLQYLAYNVTAAESSLSKAYRRGDPVLADTAAVTGKGWAETKRVYMDSQDIHLDLSRFGKVLHKVRATVVRSRASILLKKK
ncbi:hypothetical protein KSP39_PZI017545 [Platanthera zijinensis]|uniref:Glycosyltransferase 61 catalytic domain-containing protein n=1 Tax=Platanthera zijinensis TaxID=2320716 RepID=A0AAP0FZW3_9ASPA